MAVSAHAQTANIVNPNGVSNRLPSGFGKQGNVFSTPKKVDKAAPLLLEGDELIYDTKNNRVVAKGDVRIYYDEYILTADQVTYNQSANTLKAEGNVQIKTPAGEVIRSEQLDITDDFRDAFVQNLSVIAKDDSRIVARRAVRKDGNVSEFEQGRFTACKNDPGVPPLWCISGSRIVHDQQAASITYQDAQFELFGVPVAYMPFFSHPDPSVKRATGFLAPVAGYSSTLGYSVHLPYYFALAPDYDFLFHPRYFSTHGVLWQGDWRQRIQSGDIKGEYIVKLAGIDQDASTLPSDMDPTKRARLDGWRGSLQTSGLFSLSSWWRLGWDVTLESDDTFRRFYKLDAILQTDRVNTAFLEGLSERNYFGMKLYQFGGLLLENRSASESRVHPVIDYNYILAQPVIGGELSFRANATSLSRADGTDSNRVSIESNWRRKIIDPLGQTWTPFASLRADAIQFTNGFDPDLGASVPQDQVFRAVGAAGVTYAYPFVAHTSIGSHVIEPTAQIVTRPATVTQRRLPDEDAKSLVFDDSLLFDTDKFSGWDRIETGTRANIGLQYMFQANGGGYARFVAGQSFHLGGTNAFASPGTAMVTDVNGLLVPEPNFSPGSGLETNKSDYVLGAYISPVSNFKFVAQGRFDDADLSLRRANILSNFGWGPVNVSGQYSYTSTDPVLGILHAEQEVIGSGQIKLTDRWSIGGMARYDIDQKFLLQDQVLLKYSDECFILTATYTETYINNPTLDLKPDRSIFLRVEFKYLGESKYKADNIDQVLGINQSSSSSTLLGVPSALR